MRRLSLLMAVGVSLAVAVAAVATGPANTASASPKECVGATHGFADIPDALSGKVVRRGADLGSGAKLTLETGVFRGVKRGWAKLTNVRPGDQLWMDASGTGGQTWLQCGPFVKGPSRTTQMTTPAQFTTSKVTDVFRACGESGNRSEIRCTEWW